mmetsp:Transcript_27850/g.46323  ORF Transcript_27850/g.46323 Transcript_27850/m.46323 type:complete len:205 (+) Transcript_27850:745-1359(+)
MSTRCDNLCSARRCHQSSNSGQRLRLRSSPRTRSCLLSCCIPCPTKRQLKPMMHQPRTLLNCVRLSLPLPSSCVVGPRLRRSTGRCTKRRLLSSAMRSQIYPLLSFSTKRPIGNTTCLQTSSARRSCRRWLCEIIRTACWPARCVPCSCPRRCPTKNQQGEVRRGCWSAIRMKNSCSGNRVTSSYGSMRLGAADALRSNPKCTM